MKLRDQVCIWMTAALLLELLSGCHADQPADISDRPDASDRPAQGQRVGELDKPENSEEPLPEPSEEPDLWDPAHRLDISFTPAGGLELPVSGATGYATVKLPLWKELPEEGEGKLAAIYAPPGPSARPSEEALPIPEPEPPAETAPAPEGPGEPGLEGGGPDPLADGAEAEADEPPDAPGGPEDGRQESIVTAEPTDGPSPEPGGEPAGEPSPEPGEEPAAEPTDGPSPESGEEPAAEPADGPSPEPGGEAAAEPAGEPSPGPGEESGEEREPEPEPDPMGGALMVLEPGTAFTILWESGDWWQVQVDGETGWVEHRYCLINLPDVVPSIIYNDTNLYSSAFASSGRDIPGVTGESLYHAEAYNPRLGYEEFIIPVLYSMAKNVCQAQQNALAEGNTLVLYEGYRPYSVQMKVVRNLSTLAKADSMVSAGISTPPWNISWFIATGSSNHQEGYAIDVSLAKVTAAHEEDLYGCLIVRVDGYEEYAMPTPIHELSMAAATYTKPVTIFSTTAWRTAEMAPGMAVNEPAKALHRYCTDAALTPMASEWWHFNDLAAYNQIKTYHSTGEFEITGCLSTAP